MEERLFAKIRPGDPGECRWRWASTATNGIGYGVIRVGGKKTYAHRLVYELVFERAIPEGYEIDHLCGRGGQGCVTPEHLDAVTPAENKRRQPKRRPSVRAA